NKNLKSVISLGEVPLPNNLLSQEDLNKQDELYHLELMYCDNCHLCQLSHVAPPKKMFENYFFVSSTTETNKQHFKEMAEEIIESYNLNNDSVVVDIGSNDGLFLKYFKEKGIKICGIDPAKNICKIAEKNGIETINDFINEESAKEVIKRKGKADVVTANNVFAHLDDIKGFIDNTKKIMKDDGIFVLEAQYLLDTIKGGTFDNIYHEHHSYYSVIALDEFFKRNNMEIIKVKHIEGHGGSIQVYTQKKGGGNPISPSVSESIYKEISFGLKNFSTYQKFAENIYKKKEEVKELILRLKSEGKKIIGYGAPAKATTSLNFYGIDNSHIDYIIEDNPLKHGKIIPGVRIPIIGKESINESPDYIYILAWNYAKEIMENNSFYRNQGTKFIVSGENKIEIL
ncbi:MAG: class I SAM-dependent methyltransferase, partial [Nanoarchaeota archaeon]|nr:class I SAM-dependent methyltransferase [Nanoarchaeota archaeon]